MKVVLNPERVRANRLPLQGLVAIEIGYLSSGVLLKVPVGGAINQLEI